MESDVQPSLHQNCHHQFVFAKFDLSIYYPPPYERTVWDYNRANPDLVRRAIDLFDWDKALRFNDVDKQVAIFSDTLMNIMQNFIPNETIICDDRDHPWINKEIKQLTEQKKQFYKRFIQSNKSLLYINQFKELQDELGFLIEKSKNSYYSKLSQELSNKATSSEAYWSILKTFLNNKKIPCIPPVFQNNKFVINFKEKAELFNTFFAEQCSLSKNNSELPKSLLFLTEKRLSNVQISNENTIKIINNLNPNKAHGHDTISIRMLKL